MDHLDSVADEISSVESENPWNVMHVHCGYQFRVVDFDALNIVFHYQALPLTVDRRRIGEQGQGLLDDSHFPQHQSDRKPETISLDRPRGNVPEFRNVLEREVQRLPTTE